MGLNQRNWGVVHKFEAKNREALFKKLHTQGSFKIFSQLYQFGYNLAGKDYFKKINRDKIKSLSRVHSVFNKIKA